MNRSISRWLLPLLCAMLLAAGPAASEVAAAPVGSVSADDTTGYVVADGDTLSAIADRFGTTVTALVEANRLANPDALVIGQRLVIPGRAAPGRAPLSDPLHLPALRYVVEPGDSLARIALHYRVPLDLLRARNGLWAGMRLYVGQDLLVPILSGLGAASMPVIEIEPAVPIQGQAAAVRISGAENLTITARYAGTTLVTVKSGKEQWALMGIHPLTAPGLTWLGLDIQGLALPPQIEAMAGGEAVHLSWPVPVQAGTYETQDVALPPGKSELLDPTLVSHERLALQTVWNEHGLAPQWTGVFTRPLASAFEFTSPFGTRRSYNGGPVSSFHEGQDFGAPLGTPVYAPALGKVVLAEPLAVRGNAVIIDHGAGLHTGYWHLSKIDVVVGQVVEPGDLLGEVGTTGLSTGWHLHWEMRIEDVPVDPLPWLTRALP